MIARITRLLLLIQGGIAVGIAIAIRPLFPGEHGMAAAIATAVLTVFAVRLAITANNFLLASRYRSALPERFRISRTELLKLFFSEFYATMMSSSWTMPFRRFSRRIPAAPEGLPVLLVHGYGCNSGYWHAMSKALLDARIAHDAIDMEPVIGSIDEYAMLIDRAVERLCNERGASHVVIVAHSMGGLATRAYIRRHGHARLAKAITLGTPHRGTALAHFGVGVNTHQMRWTASEQEGLASEWLQQLAATETADVYARFVSIYSHHDNIISPQTSSHLKGAKNIEFHAIGHVALALNPRVQGEVIKEIRRTTVPA